LDVSKISIFDRQRSSRKLVYIVNVPLLRRVLQNFRFQGIQTKRK